MLDISKICIKFGITIPHSVLIGVLDQGQIRCIRDPKNISHPTESLNIVEASGKLLAIICHTIKICVDQFVNRVPGSVRLGLAILGAHPHEKTSSGIECHGAWISYQRIAGKKAHLQIFGDDRKIIVLCVQERFPRDDPT